MGITNMLPLHLTRDMSQGRHAEERKDGEATHEEEDVVEEVEDAGAGRPGQQHRQQEGGDHAPGEAGRLPTGNISSKYISNAK
jgi:hypothetical protein